MVVALIALVLVVVLLLCVVGALAVRCREVAPSAWSEKVRRSVIVTLRSGVSFQGVLWSIDDELMVLRDAAMLTPDGVAGVDGEVVLERSSVDYVQVLP